MKTEQELDGRTLSRGYYEQVVLPLLRSRWPGLPHAAGRLGQGSDVLGLDDNTSRDHDWGLRLTLLVDTSMTDHVASYLDTSLPDLFNGYPTRFAFTGKSEPIHHVDVFSVSGFSIDRLGLDPRQEMSAADWLSLTGQNVLEVTAGPLFADTTGEMSDVRRTLEWYPNDLWRYVVACDWQQIDEELPLMSRAGSRGDDIGSRLIAARLVDILVHLAFLLERTWAPYSKWRGTRFGKLDCANRLLPPLSAALAAANWQTRQSALDEALELLLDVQRAAGLPAPTPATVPFFDRPFRKTNSAITEALLASITDPTIRSLPPGRGSIEQCTANVAILVDPAARRRVVTCGPIPGTKDHS